MGEIRVRFSGIAVFLSSVLAYIIGMAFTVYVARALTKEEYGIYGFIASLYSLALMLSSAISFWAFRARARGRKVIGTAVLGEIILSVPASLTLGAYLLTHAGLDLQCVFVVMAYVVIGYLVSGLNVLFRAIAPHKTSYRSLIVSIVKISVGLLLVFYLRLLGALITLTLGVLIYGLYVLRYAGGELRGSIDLDLLRQWLYCFWIVIILNSANVIFLNADMYYLGFNGLFSALGSYTAAKRIANWMTLASSLSIGLSPALLSGGGKENVDSVLDLMMMFTVPMVVGAVVMSKDLVCVFGAKYMEASNSLEILAISMLFFLLSNVLDGAVRSLDDVDRYELKLRSLLKSYIFKLAVLSYVGLAVELLSMLLLAPRAGLDGIALSVLCGSVTLLIIRYNLARKVVQLSLTRLVKRSSLYLMCSLIMALVLSVLPKGRISLVILSVGVGCVVYFLLLYLADEKFRGMVCIGLYRDIIPLIRRKIHSSRRSRTMLLKSSTVFGSLGRGTLLDQNP